jgi:FkbM family methyltransferase
MDVFDFYTHWKKSQFESEVGDGSVADFSFFRNKFENFSLWGFFKRKFSFKVKLCIKSIVTFPRIIFNYHVSPGEKDFAIDYVNYICQKRPILDENIFSIEDMGEIRNFLKKQFHFAHFDYVPRENIFPDHDYDDFLTANRKNSSFLKKNRDCYEYNGFKTRYYAFEYGVLANRCGLGYVPDEVSASVKDRVVVDCGAFTGDSVYFFTSLCPKKIIALEPDENNFKVLQDGIALNEMDNVIPLLVGAGSARNAVKFSNDGAGARIAEKGTSEIRIDRIDNIVDDVASGERVGLIKMDIEGYEKAALEGAEHTIRNDKPVLVIAIYHSGKDFFEIPPYVKSLNSHYRFAVVHSNPLTPTFEEYLIAY